MVDVAQLAEHQIVVLGVVGSSPIFHPKATASEFREPFFVFLTIAAPPLRNSPPTAPPPLSQPPLTAIPHHTGKEEAK